MHKLRIGIIGTGMAFEKLHYPAYQNLSDKYEIAAICDINEKKRQQWQQKLGLKNENVYSNFRNMLKRNDIDAYDIMVPIELNFETTEAVAKTGKPLICEKPLAANREEALKAQKLPEKYNIPIMIAENYRYNDENNIIRDLVRNREIGAIYYFIQNRVVDFPADMYKDKFPATEWRQRPEFPGGAILDSAVHDIGAFQHIFGAVESVHAAGVQQKEPHSPYSIIQSNLMFKSGMTGQYSFFSAGKEMQRPLLGLRIFGSSGMIYLEEKGCGTINVAYNDGNSKQIPYEAENGFYNELLNFYQAAAGNKPLSVTPEIEFGDVMTIFAMLESARENKVVGVSKVEKYKPAYI